MKLKYKSEYDEFTMFLTEFKIGADAIVFDKDVGTSLLCRVVEITESDHARGNYDAEFIIPDGNFMVGVECVRPEAYPNEFFPAISTFNGIYC